MTEGLFLNLRDIFGGQISTIRPSSRERNINTMKPPLTRELFEIDEAFFFQSSSLGSFFNFIILRTSFLIVENEKSFPDSEIIKIKNILKGKELHEILPVLTNQEYSDLCLIISFLHNNFIWKSFKTKKGRLVYAIKEEFHFMKASHNLVKLIRKKVLDFDIYDKLNIPNHSFSYLLEVIDSKFKNYKVKKTMIGNKDTNFYNTVFKLKRNPEGIFRKRVEFFNNNCSFGVSPGFSALDAVKIHKRPDNMVVFDIKSFYPTFKTEKIKSNRLFESIYESLFNAMSFSETKLRNQELTPLSDEYKMDAIKFYELFDAFSYNGNLPTGATFSSDLSNLLFFSVDIEIQEEIDKIKKEIKDKFVFTKDESFASPRRIVPLNYTRYVDDICITIDLVSLFSALSHRRNTSLDDYKNAFIGMKEIKRVEKILNKKGFFIKYEKTKIYSYKMDKSYLGYSFIRKIPSERERGSNPSIINLCLSSNYRISTPSKRRLEFKQSFYSYSSLSNLEKERLRGYYNYSRTLDNVGFGSSRIADFSNSDSLSPRYVFSPANISRTAKKKRANARRKTLLSLDGLDKRKILTC